MKTRRHQSTHVPTMAAGGIVVITGRSPLIAVVQRRKDDGWTLPRGKLRPKESALTAARREVGRETGHNVAVREFLGTISCKSGGRSKIIQFWLMASLGHAGQKSTSNAKAVKWLPLNAAVGCLTEPLERAFLAQIGQQSLKEMRGKLRSGKSRPSHAISSNGRQALAPRKNVRTGDVAHEKQPYQINTLNRSSGAPKFYPPVLSKL